MAGTSIGKLNVQIGGNAAELDKVISGAEKRIMGFTAKAVQWPNSLSGAFSKLGNVSVNSIDTLMKTAGGIVDLVPGGALLSMTLGLDKGITGMVESGQRGLERESERFGVEPSFMRAFQLSGGKDAEIAGKVIDKSFDALSALRSGGLELPGGLDVNKLRKNDPSSFLLSVADMYKSIGDQADRLNFLGSIVGNKMADDAHFFFSGGAAKILANQEKADAIGTGSPELGRLSDIKARADRAVALHKEGMDNRNAIYSGADAVLQEMYQSGKINELQLWANSFGNWMSRETTQNFLDKHTWNKPQYMTPKDEGTVKLDYDAKAKEAERKAEREARLANQTYWEDETMKLAASVASPSQQFYQQAAKIALSGLDDAQANQALDKAYAGAFGTDAAIAQAKQQFAQQNANQYRPNAAVSAGSSDLFNAINEALGTAAKSAEPSIDELVTLAQKNLDDQKKAIEQRDEINRRLRERNTPAVWQIPPA